MEDTMEPTAFGAEVIDNRANSISEAAGDEEPDTGPVAVLPQRSKNE